MKFYIEFVTQRLELSKKIGLFFILLFFSFTIQAQNSTVRGTITDAKTNEPLIGASVLIEGTTLGAAADLDGHYVIQNVPSGTHSLVISYVAYESVTRTGVVLQNNQEIVVDIQMTSDDISLEEVEVVARVNRESEHILLMEQRQALLATQAVGARELSRRGIGDARAAVAQVSGISRQEGVKNVFVRGLGDRYNVTLLNGFPIPSEDPEYKNIALEFFGTDIIQHIGVNKVFRGSSYADVGGAIIDITSKELVGDQAFAVDLSAGLNTAATGSNFLRQDGANYFGFTNSRQPVNNRFDFPNSLDPMQVSLPMNHSYGFSGGKMFHVGENRNPLSFFLVASHSSDYSYTREIVRNSITSGLIYQDQEGKKYSQNTNQLVLGNLNYGLDRKHNIAYNFMLIHANNQYVGEYFGKHGEKHQDSEDYMGFHRRQQENDNYLIVNQLNTDWRLTDKMNLEVSVSYNHIKGLEPDRRENYLSRMTDGTYILTGSNRQKRFFSTLKENDINAKAVFTYGLRDRFGSGKSSIKFGYTGRYVNDNFEAVEYNFTAVPGTISMDPLWLDDYYNDANLKAGLFGMTTGEKNSYEVTKFIHSGFVEGTWQLFTHVTSNIGLRMDVADLKVSHHVQHVQPGEESIRKNYFLPSLNLKYDLNHKNSLRMGASKSYTLPQSKEISPYQYVNISFSSQGNPNIKPSDNYNVDLKWDYYMNPGELLTLTGFYKYIVNPIGRVDQGNSAGLLTYDNISDHAVVSGLEFEIRKNLFNRFNTQLEKMNRLSVGLNASYIYTNLTLDMLNTEPRSSSLEGASPFLANLDFSYTHTKKEKSFVASIIFNYFSHRIHTVGAKGFKDIIEEGLPSLDFASSYSLNNHLSLKLKAKNLLNASYRFSRESSLLDEKIILNELKKGINISLGASYEF